MKIRNLIFVLLYSFPVRLINAQCEIDIIGRTETVPETPLLLHLDSKELVYPKTDQKDNKIRLGVGEKVDLACPGTQIVLPETKTEKKKKKVLLTAQCISTTEESKKKFDLVVDEVVGKKIKRYEWKQIFCEKIPQSTARDTGGKCGEEQNGKEIEIGYHISTNRFVRLILSCFDKKTQSTNYTYFDMLPNINQGAKGVVRSGWIQSEFFQIPDMNLLYRREQQRETINALLGLPAKDKTYIKDDNYFLSRGHLTAKADMFYAASQLSTFRFLNALPQWQTVNGANWNKIEDDVKDYAQKRKVHLQIWTGGYGVTTLTHAQDKKKDIPLYLYVHEDERLVPVPDVFWKVVYNSVTKHGVALISSNNPYKRVTPFCQDVSSSLLWLHLAKTKNNQMMGISWACNVSTFRETVKYFPDIEVIDILQ